MVAVPYATVAPTPSVVEQAIAAARTAWQKGERDPFEFVVVDAFCGAGGSSTGMVRSVERLNREGFVCRPRLQCVNHSKRAITTHKANHGHAEHFIEDMTTVDPWKVVPGGYVHLFMASPECIFFSRARGSKPVNDQRRMQPWHLLNWADRLYVQVFWVENVPEIVDWGPLCTLPEDHEKHSTVGLALPVGAARCAKETKGGLCMLAKGHDAHVHEDSRVGRSPTALRHGLTPCNKPDPTRKGETFQSWIAALRGLGYDLEWKNINAADQGSWTTRTRFFLQARKDGLAITWPQPTHRNPRKRTDPWDTRATWRGCREIIDWSVPGESIFDRKKPLSVNTRCRMARGMDLYTGEWAPFYVDLLDLPADKYAPAAVPTMGEGELAPPAAFVSANRSKTRPRPGAEPLHTATAQKGGNLYMVEPTAYVCANRAHSVPRDPSQPIPTATADHGGGNIFVTEPVITRVNRSTKAGSGIRSVEDPLPTQTKKLGLGITQGQAIDVGAFQLNQRDGNGVGRSTRSVEQPSYSPTTIARPRLVRPSATAAFVLAQGGGGVARGVDSPAPTNVGGGATSLTVPEAHVVSYNGNGAAHSVQKALPAQTTKDRFGLADPQAFAVRYHGEHAGQLPRASVDLDAPLPTVTSGGNRFGLAEPKTYVLGRHSSGVVRDPATDPLPAGTRNGAGYVVEPGAYIVPKFGEAPGQAPRVHGLGDSLPTVTTEGAGRLIRPTATALSLDLDDAEQAQLAESMRLMPKRFVLDILTGVLYFLDILFRMLLPQELAASMGFNRDGEYVFTGTRTEQIEQIGNAVDTFVAEALSYCILRPMLEAELVRAFA